MARTNEYYVLCTMPESLFKELQDDNDMFGIDVYDKSYYKHYKNNEEWQQADEKAKEAREDKKQIEFNIRKEIDKC